MSLFAQLRRRFDLRPPPFGLPAQLSVRPSVRDRGEPPPGGRREPPGANGLQVGAYLAIAEAVQDGADVVPASAEAGRRLAEAGFSLVEALDGLSALYRSIMGAEPAFAAVRALSCSWAESSLVYLHAVSCEDPLTRLASLAHVQSRLSELYREAELQGTTVPVTHALVVVEPLNLRDLPVMDRELRLVDVAECLRIVFCGGGVLGRLGPSRAAALVGRDPGLPEQVETVRALATHWRLVPGLDEPTRVWIEGLPASVEWASRVLDELARP